jgi:putative FmdB family regulatory protein
MPTYDFKCDACGHTFEKMQLMSAAPLKKCPKCGKNKVRRLIGTGAGLIFKGSGFYITDYRDSGYKDQAKADGPPAAAKEGSAPAGDAPATPTKTPTSDAPATPAKPAAESKPAPKAEPKSDRSSGKKSSKSE